VRCASPGWILALAFGFGSSSELTAPAVVASKRSASCCVLSSEFGFKLAFLCPSSFFFIRFRFSFSLGGFNGL
jgi:hypothetical protein